MSTKEIKMRKIITLFLSVVSILLFAIALTACGQSDVDYAVYLEQYIARYGTDEGALTEHEWDYIQKSGKIDRTKIIDKIEIRCGNYVVIYLDASTSSVKGAPYVEHRWDEGKITTAPTCTTVGVKTYSCFDCGERKQIILDTDNEGGGCHLVSKFEVDEKYHWGLCSLCGDFEKREHDFGDINQDDPTALIKCVCGIHCTVGELYAYKIEFVYDTGVSVRVYPTQDYFAGGEVTTIAYSRDKFGELKKDGEGQVNFRLEPALGYRIGGITILPEDGYKNCKGEEETGEEGVYRITKISSDLVVHIEVEPDAFNLPIIMIETENGAAITSREDYVSCTVTVSNAVDEYCIIEKSAEIRGRGNTTWSYPKKPYRIKFDKKQDMFGFGEYKSWVLLASYQDFSNIKDYAAFHFADSICGENSAFVPRAKHVELYLNGEYKGLFLLTDQIQENSGRVGVEEDFDETAIEVPFLVEWDAYAQWEGDEGVDWFSIVNTDSGVTSYYAISYPEKEDRYTQEQFDYIKNYIITVNTMCHDPNITFERFDEYIDCAAFIDYYLIQEFMGQGEINGKSIRMSKAVGGKLVMGPIWDFDWAATGPVSIGSTWGSEGWMSNTNWFAYMLQKNWFHKMVCNRWAEIKDILQSEIAVLRDYKLFIQDAAERNAVLWDFIEDDNPEFDFDGYYDKIIRFFEERHLWIDKQLGN